MEEDLKYKFLPEKIDNKGSFWEVSQEGLYWIVRVSDALPSQEGKVAQEKKGQKLGWKLHISLADEGDNIEQGWDLIIDLLKECGIKSCKVLAKGSHLLGFQWGKEITLYHQEDQAELVDWQSLLDEITARFVNNGIRPNCLAFNDMLVNGSSFFGIRNDEGKEGGYEVGLLADNFNPANKKIPDELAKVKILNSNQPTRKVRKCETVLKTFYKDLLEGLLDSSQLFIQIICPLSPYLRGLGKKLQIWELNAVAIEDICSDFPSTIQGLVRMAINDIKEIYAIQAKDLFDKEEQEIVRMKKHYLQKIKLVKNVIIELPNEINAAIKAEEDLALIATVVSNPSSTGNSGDNSRESKSDSSKSSSKEGSPREPDGGEKPNFG